MTLKMAHRVPLRVLWCVVVFSGTLEWSFVFQSQIGGDPSGGLEVSYVGLGILVRVFEV